MNIIELKNVCFAYNSSEVIRNLSCTFKESMLTGIIGPNGAGKSTLLRIIGGILTKFQGEVLILGEDLKEIKPLKRAEKIGFVPQETNFTLNYRVEDIVAMGRYPYLKPFKSLGREDLLAVEEALECTELTEFRKRPILSLSAGERQRVIIARALAQRPRILLLDEPTSHLDLHHQWTIMEILKNLTTQKMTVIIVHHDLNLASLYCSHLLLMSEGRIYAQGTPIEIITPENLKNVYKTEIEIIFHPVKKIPQVLMK
uniref:ABC transporter ATP-binding protein n=1 Tax=candidate division WOR-3 bacterium TaxID=2052148 RepID=A0A7C4TAM9_UNCW3